MDQGIKVAVINLNRELERKHESEPDALGLVEIPQILQTQCGFPRTVGELTIEQCIRIAAIANPEAFERLERAKQEWDFRKLKSKRHTKH
jgi:hypothetical protein